MTNFGMAFALCLALLAAPAAWSHGPDAPAGPASAASAPAPVTTIVQAGTLLLVAGEAPKPQQTLVVRGKKVLAAHDGWRSGAELGLPGAVELNLRDKFVMPGLMDMHVHLTLTPESLPALARKYPEGSSLADLGALIDATANARATLQAGYTTVRDTGSSGSAMFVMRQAIERGAVEGPRVFIAGPIIATQADPDNLQCSGVEGCRKAVRTLIDRGVDLIKVYGTCSGSKPCGEERAPPLFLDDELRAIVETAHTRQLKVAVHAHGTAGINAALRAGVDSIEHGSFNDAESHQLFKKHGAFLVPTLAVGDRIRSELPTAAPEMKALMEQFIARHAANTMAAFKAGVRIASGSDAGIVAHGTNARELELYVANGMPAMKALETATVSAAALLGKSQDLGALRPGMTADVIALDGNPLQDIAALRRVAFVMKDGSIFKQPSISESKP